MSFHILQDILNSDDAALVETDADLEAELLHYLLQALDCTRPSLILQLTRQCNSTSQFIECIKSMNAAAVFTESAEAIAEKAEIAVSDHEGRRERNVYRLIMTAARDASVKDAKWESNRAKTLRVAGWMKGGEQ